MTLSKSNGFVNFREKMAQAYDFALEKIGMDLQSYSIWNDYVTFLKGVEAIGSYAENQKISAVRKVCTVYPPPHHNCSGELRRAVGGDSPPSNQKNKKLFL